MSLISPDHAVVTKLSEEEMQEVYNWVDEIPLSRPKKNIARDFSDCVLIAEIMKHFLPALVELHNYSNAHSVQQKSYNWNTINQKVFKKIALQLTVKDIKDAVEMVPETIERILFTIRFKIDNYLASRKQKRLESAGMKRNRSRPQVMIQDNQMMPQQQPFLQNMQNMHNLQINPQQQPVQAQIILHNENQLPMSEIQNNMQYNAQTDAISDIQKGVPPMSAARMQDTDITPIVVPKHKYGAVSNGGSQVMPDFTPTDRADQKSHHSQFQQYAQDQQEGFENLLQEKDQTINQLRQTVEILELKIKKLEQLVKLKDAKIGNLTSKLSTFGIQ